MPGYGAYTGNTSKRTRRMRIRSGKRRRISNDPFGTRLARLRRRVANIYRERKFHDTLVTGQTQSTTTAKYNLCTVAQGAGDNNRDGNMIQLYSVWVNGEIYYTTADAYNYVRIVLVQVKDDNENFVAADLFEAPGTPWISPFKINGQRKYKVLSDIKERVETGAVAGTLTTGRLTVPFQMEQRFFGKNALVRYKDGDNDAQNNGLFLFVCSDSSAVTHPTITFYTRIKFFDS